MVNGEARKERRRALLKEASRDLLYLAELEILEQEYEHVDVEAWHMIDEMEEHRIQRVATIMGAGFDEVR